MMDEETALVARLEALRTEHRDLDDAIARMEEVPGADQLRIRDLDA